MTSRIHIHWLLSFILGSLSSPATELFVSPTGNDKGPGTREQPFASLERARDQIRESGQAGKVPHTIWLAKGLYRMDRPLQLETRDSGTSNAPITYRSIKPGQARLSAGTPLPPETFQPIRDPETLARIRENLRKKILSLDLENTKTLPDFFPHNGNMVELFIAGKRLPISRYPNEFGAMTMKKVIVNGGGQETKGKWKDYYSDPSKRKEMQKAGPRPGIFQFQAEHQAAHERWSKVLDRGVWMKGYWRVVWENQGVRVSAIDPITQQITLSTPVPNGIGSKYHRPEGSGKEIYWVMNLLEEIDQPGEWAIDFKDQKLYLLPPPEFTSTGALLTERNTPVIELKNTSHLHLQGLVIEDSLGDGIHVRGGNENRILGCEVRNIRKYGIRIEGGKNHLVRSCEIHSLGAGGIWLSGGDSTTSPRTPAGHQVINNDIHHFGQIETVYAPGINVGFQGGGGGSRKIDAVGMRIAQNAIHHCPHAGILFNSYDNIFEFNEIFQYALVSNDMGAFYSYSKKDSIGNTTLRHNFYHSSPEGDGIYFDNLANQPVIEGNIAYRLGSQQSVIKAKRGCAYLIKNFGKSPITFHGNLAIDCRQGTYANWDPKSSSIRDNLVIGCAQLSNKVPGVTAWISEPPVTNLSSLAKLLEPNSPLYQSHPKLPFIPLDKIGLQPDPLRPVIPDYRRELDKWTYDGQSAGYEIMDRE